MRCRNAVQGKRMWFLTMGGILVGLGVLPEVMTAGDQHFMYKVVPGPENATFEGLLKERHEETDQERRKEHEEDTTTASLSKGDLEKRSTMYYTVFGTGLASLGVLGVYAVWKKHGNLEVGHLKVARGRGLLWREKPLCQIYMELPVEQRQQQQQQQEGELRAGQELLNVLGAEEGGSATTQEDIQKGLLEQDLVYKSHEDWLWRRSLLLKALFLAYVGTSVGIPIINASHVSCEHGFFWEDHVPFFGLFLVTKFVELWLYTSDVTVHGDLDCVTFMVKFLPSFLGYLDGYTDATAITIAHACHDNQIAQKLWISMACTYAIGVIFSQWIVVAYMANKDPTQASLMKLIHFDALSSCISLPEESQTTWFVVNMVRTLGEDIPQAIQQSLFIIFIQNHPFMVLSVVVSVGSSVKAMVDAYNRTALAAGLKELPQLQGHSDVVQSVAVFPDGSQVTTHSSERRSRVWDAVSGQELRSRFRTL